MAKSGKIEYDNLVYRKCAINTNQRNFFSEKSFATKYRAFGERKKRQLTRLKIPCTDRCSGHLCKPLRIFQFVRRC